MQKQIIYTEDAPKPIGPYSQGVLVKDTLYASGQIAYDASLSGDIEKESLQVMKNLEAVLKIAEMGFGNVVKCSIFLKSVEVSKLPKDVNVEISLIAVK
jgi:2-iminobutanoate/2-iminopropanoate deaminase